MYGVIHDSISQAKSIKDIFLLAEREEPFKSDYNKKMSGPTAHRGKLLRAAT
ncbi:hypothetical protein FOZ62_020177, partial [Perkinsus olseni]